MTDSLVLKLKLAQTYSNNWLMRVLTIMHIWTSTFLHIINIILYHQISYSLDTFKFDTGVDDSFCHLTEQLKMRDHSFFLVAVFPKSEVMILSQKLHVSPHVPFKIPFNTSLIQLQILEEGKKKTVELNILPFIHK